MIAAVFALTSNGDESGFAVTLEFAVGFVMALGAIRITVGLPAAAGGLEAAAACPVLEDELGSAELVGSGVVVKVMSGEETGAGAGADWAGLVMFGGGTAAPPFGVENFP